MNDKSLRQDIIHELEFEPSIDATSIGVAMHHGVATLSGHVENFAQKIAAEQAVWRVKGVKAVAQEIQVRSASEKKDADDQIAERIVHILNWDSTVPRGAVHATVTNGWVTLTGKVTWHYQRDAAMSDVYKLSGVVGVSNNITLEPLAQASDIKREIEAALRRRAEVDAQGIQVQVNDNGDILLEGTVRDWSERQAVENAVWSTAGVRTVEDRVRIA